MKAVWVMDYDHTEDKTYYRPGCPECQAPVGKDIDDEYHCYSCGKVVSVEDPERVRWFAEMSDTMTEMSKCWRCGRDNALKTLYIRNPVSRKWQAASGECRECGMRFIV